LNEYGKHVKGKEAMKYHSLLSTRNGLNSPPMNPCKLLDFGFLKLGAGETYSSESGDREVLAVLLVKDT
jgi:5-deoxy-glucuronate isomerase